MVRVMQPMREPTYFILAALIGGPLHGWAIIHEARVLSGGRVHLTAGTLYGALDRLASDGLVEAEGEDVVNGRRRRYYRLTSTGGAALAGEAERLLASAKVVTRRVASLRRLHVKGATQ